MALTKEGVLKVADLLYVQDELQNPIELRVSLLLGGSPDVRILDTITILDNQVLPNFLRVLTQVTNVSFNSLNGTLEYTFTPAEITALGADYVFDRIALWRQTNEVGVWTGDFVSGTFNITGPFLSGTTTLYTNNLVTDDRVFIRISGVLTEVFVDVSTPTTLTFKDAGGTPVVPADATDQNVIDGVGELIQVNALTTTNTVFLDTSKTFNFLSVTQSV